MLDQSMNWKDAEKLCSQWGGHFALKGIMSVEDAKKAAAEEYKKKYEAKIVPSQTDTTKTDTIFKRKYNINFREKFLN